MTIDGDLPRAAEQPVVDAPPPYAAQTPAPRDAWFWVQLSGLACLAAGVAVLVAFALTLGGR